MKINWRLVSFVYRTEPNGKFTNKRITPIAMTKKTWDAPQLSVLGGPQLGQ